MFESVFHYLQSINWDGLGLLLFRSAIILILAWVLTKVIGKLMVTLHQRLMNKNLSKGDTVTESSKRAETIIRLVKQASFIFLWAMVGLTILNEIGVKIGPILAGAGILGLAVGFGGQNLVRDVIAGFFFILENQVRVGDVVIVNGTSGLVEEINFRTIVLRDLSGVVHIFPNGSVTSLSNMTKNWSAYLFEVGIPYKNYTDSVFAVIEQAGKEMLGDPHFGHLMLEAPEIFGVDKFTDSNVVIKGRIKTRPIHQWEVGREFNRRVKQAFDAAGIEIPFLTARYISGK